MCGISAFLGADGAVGRTFVERAQRLMGHRGPDDSGTYTAPGIVLGHLRLSIVDLSAAGHEPMVSPDGRFVLVYNGEVYNHADLRHRLCSGWPFKGRSDAETVLAVLAQHGAGALSDLVGMWALALWDARERKLLISRDRYGQKPLYWRRTAHGLLLASEIKPLLGQDERPHAHLPAVAEYLANGNYGHLHDRTFFEDIRAVPPGHWAVAEPANQVLEFHRYWRFPCANGKARAFDVGISHSFRDRFVEAVSSQLMSDVPVGALLSGGIDSSAVVGAMATVSNGPIEVFTAQCRDAKFDESSYVRAVERKWARKLNVHWVAIDDIAISQTLYPAIRVQEEPFGDPSIIAHGLLMDAARDAGVRVLLSGQGADELLFGYPYMVHALVAVALRRGRVGWSAVEARALGFDTGTMLRIGLAAALPRFERLLRRRRRRSRRVWLTPRLVTATEATLELMSDASAVWLDAVERTALPHLVHYDDRNAMARSIETRMPFLDHRLADIVCDAGWDAFLSHGQTKRLLREACRDLIPHEVIDRRDKIGFYTPLRAMLTREADWIRARLTDDAARDMGFYDTDRAAAMLEDVMRDTGAFNDTLSIWRALSVRLWAETFSVRTLGD